MNLWYAPGHPHVKAFKLSLCGNLGHRNPLARRKFSIKKSRFTDQQIAFALQQAEQGAQVAEVTRKMGISEQTFYRWKKKFEGLMPSEVRKFRQLEEENAPAL